MPEKRSKLILIRTIAGLFVLFSGISMIMNYHYIMKSVADGLNKDSISANLLGKLLREHEKGINKYPELICLQASFYRSGNEKGPSGRKVSHE